MAKKAFDYPVMANGRLYIRDLETLWAYDIKSKPLTYYSAYEALAGVVYSQYFSESSSKP